MKNGIIVCAIVACAGSAAAQVTVFTDRAAWEAAAGDFAVETFDGAAIGPIADGATLDTGILQITRDGSANGGDGALEIEDGSGFGNLNGSQFLSGETGITPHEEVVFDAGLPFTAFGGDWFSPFSGDGIALQAGDDVILLDSIAGFGQGFIGFISAAPVSEVRIVGTVDDISFQELWSVDNISFAVVPAPASAALLGLGGLAAIRRRR